MIFIFIFLFLYASSMIFDDIDIRSNIIMKLKCRMLVHVPQTTPT